MRFKKLISLLTTIIVILALVASIYGIFSSSGQGNFEFKSLNGGIVSIYGIGLYKNESVSMATQAIAQDTVTLCLGIPLLIISLYLARKGLLKGRLLLTGILGYFLYTYVTYTFYAMYNPMFLIYVTIMSASFYALILSIMGFMSDEMKSNFNNKLPVKFIGGVLICISILVGLMWMKIIVSPLLEGHTPAQLEHYTTLVIQAIDLGFMLPAGIIAGIQIIKRNALGYILAPIIIVNEAALLTVIIVMLISQILKGIEIGIGEVVLFPIAAIMVAFCLYLIMKNVEELS